MFLAADKDLQGHAAICLTSDELVKIAKGGLVSHKGDTTHFLVLHCGDRDTFEEAVRLFNESGAANAD